MPTYMVQASYTDQGASGLVQNPQDRAAAIRTLIEGAGGRIESFYFAFGDSDVVIIAELPDNVTMMALAIAVGASGAVTNFRTTVLISASEGLEAARKAGSIGYRPPGS